MLILFIGQNIFRNIIFKEKNKMNFKETPEVGSPLQYTPTGGGHPTPDGSIRMDNSHFDVIRAEMYWRVAIFLVKYSLTPSR